MAWLESHKSLVFETAPLDTVDLFLDYYDSGNPRPPNTMFISSPPSYVPPGFSSLLSILRDKGHNTIFLCPLGLPFPLNSSPLDEIGDFIWKKFLLAGVSLSSSLNIILLNYVAELATTFFFPQIQGQRVNLPLWLNLASGFALCAGMVLADGGIFLAEALKISSSISLLRIMKRR